MDSLSLEDVKFIKILANSDSTLLQTSMNKASRDLLDAKISVVLREYYKENTIDAKTGWIEKFKKAGITKDEGKSAIACARRLGTDIF